MLGSFLDNAERQMGTANEEFAELLVERLGIAITNVSSIIVYVQA